MKRLDFSTSATILRPRMRALIQILFFFALSVAFHAKTTASIPAHTFEPNATRTESVTTRYVYGAGLLYEVSASNAATYYHYDQSGNTAALTDQGGSVVERVEYSPYGKIRYRQGNFDTPFLFGGFFGVMTDSNGLIAMRARYYHPLTMRFLTGDPAMEGWNWYAYANGNPMRKIKGQTNRRTVVIIRANYDAAHKATLQWQGIPYNAASPAQLYHPDVIRQFSDTFNRAAWPQ